MNEPIRRTLSADDWVTNYADLLYRHAYLRVVDKGLAEDIVQDTFLSAWRSRSTYDGSSSEKNWLFTICKNKITDHFRKIKAASTRLRELHYFDREDHWTDRAAPQEWQVEELPVNDEFYKVLSRCRSKLNEIQSAVFTMKYLDDVDSKEICRVMNISMQNYWVLIHRAKLQLRECLQVNWIDQ